MTDPLQRPPRKNPQKRTVLPTLPPFSRSRKAIAFSAAAAEGRFVLQVCRFCWEACYPAHEICPNCWSMALDWKDVEDGGKLTAWKWFAWAGWPALALFVGMGAWFVRRR